MYPAILFEGIDGAGKTYALTHLKETLESRGLPVHVVDSIPYETFMRSHDPSWFNLNINNIKYMEYLSWQVNNFYKNILPYLGTHIILIDRFVPSCFAYNTLDIKTPADSTIWSVMELFCTKFWKPDFTFLFDVQDEVLFERHKTTNQPVTMTALTFINKVRDSYDIFVHKYNWNIQKIDGSQNIDQTIQYILKTAGITSNV